MADMHSFNVDVAKEVGVNAAILLQSIKWWCEKNKANGKNYHDGLYWTYNSVKAWEELYPYLGKSAIGSALKKLEERGYIKVGSYNANAYDRTKWYAITDDGLSLFGDSIFRKSEMESTETGNGRSENQKPIPVTEQLHSNASKDKTAEIIGGYTRNLDLSEAILDFMEARRQMRAPMTEKALTMMLKKLDQLGESDEEKVAILNRSVENGWKGVFELPADQKPKAKYDEFGHNSVRASDFFGREYA